MKGASNGGRVLLACPSLPGPCNAVADAPVPADILLEVGAIARPLLNALALLSHELLLFAAIWFAVFALDELLVDLVWLRLKLGGRLRTPRIGEVSGAPRSGVMAVLVPAWRESRVIGAMVRHTFRAWPQANLRVYVGCYRNDTETLAALVAAADGDARLRVVVHDRDGPTTKADCLNRLYRAVREDERRANRQVRALVLHDAEDMVHPLALAAMDEALDEVDFVQLPVRPEPQARSRWIAGHYCDEFAEAHARDMVVRDAIRAGLPSAGVGCAFARGAIDRIMALRGAAEPFAAESLTEDYECGLLVAEAGGRSRFLRLRDAQGALVATREFFPSALPAAVRQKTRWVHGIAFQGWDRLGWGCSARGLPCCDLWMRLRDRRGPLVALALSAAYLLVLLWPALFAAEALGLVEAVPEGPLLRALVWFNAACLVWRVVLRSAFTSREYGWREGLLAVARLPVSNVIAIMAARRALVAYLRVLRGGRLRWEHTVHGLHVAQAIMPEGQPATRLAPA